MKTIKLLENMTGCVTQGQKTIPAGTWGSEIAFYNRDKDAISPATQSNVALWHIKQRH